MWAQAREAVHNCIQDSASSVRETAIDLIGRAMTASPATADSYLDMILDRVLDTGKSVRKRCVKILYQLLCAQPTHPWATKILLKISTRMDDEDTIRDMVLGTFRDLWFNPDDRPDLETFMRTSGGKELMSPSARSELAQVMRRASGGLPEGMEAPKGLGSGHAVVLTLRQRVEQLLAFISRAGPQERINLREMLKSLLGLSQRESERKVQGFVANAVGTSAADMDDMCGKLCTQIVNHLLRAEEEEEADLPPSAAATARCPNGAKVNGGKASSTRECCIMALDLFCKVNVCFLVSHMKTLQVRPG